MAPCSRCGSSALHIVHIEDQKVHHVICKGCENEWIQ